MSEKIKNEIKNKVCEILDQCIDERPGIPYPSNCVGKCLYDLICALAKCKEDNKGNEECYRKALEDFDECIRNCPQQ